MELSLAGDLFITVGEQPLLPIYNADEANTIDERLQFCWISQMNDWSTD